MNIEKFLKLLKSEANWVTGLDLGSYSVKATLLEGPVEEPRLKKQEEKIYSKNIIEDGKIIDDISFVEEMEDIKNQFPRECATALKVDDVLFSVMLFDPVEIEVQIVDYVKKVSDGMGDKLVVIYRPYPKMRDNKQYYMVLVAPESVIEKKKELVSLAGFIPYAIDYEPLSLAEQFYFNYPDVTDTAVLVDMGHTKTNIVAVSEGQVYEVRTLKDGGKTLIEDLRKDIGCSTEKAYKVLFGEDIPEIKFIEFKEMFVQSYLSRISSIISDLKYVLPEYDIDSYKKVYLYGGLANINGIDVQLSEILGEDVEIGNPTRKFKQLCPPQFAVSMGLALFYEGEKYDTGKLYI